MVVEVRGIGMVWCDFGRKSQQNLDVGGGFVRYEVGRGRVRERVWEVLLACKFLSFVSLRVEELHDISGINRQFLKSLTTTIQRLSR